MTKIHSIKPFIYTTAIAATLGLSACKNASHTNPIQVETVDVFVPSQSEQAKKDETFLIAGMKIPALITPNDEFKNTIEAFYPSEKYDVYSTSIDNMTITSVTDKANKDNKLRFVFDSQIGENGVDSLGIICTFSKDGKIYAVNYDSKGKFFFYENYADKETGSPIVDKINKDLNGKNFFGFSIVDSEKLLKDIEELTPENIIILLNEFKKQNGEILSRTLDNALSLDNKVKEKVFSHLEKVIEASLGYQKSFEKIESKIANPYYTGMDYTVEQKDEVMTICNKTTGKTFELDLKEIVKRLPFESGVKVKAKFQKLPAEVLEDFYTEINTDVYGPSIKHRIQKKKYKPAAYQLFPARLILLDEFAGVEALTLVHEIGHAMDDVPNMFFFNSPSFTKYKEVFEEELKKYKEAGNKTFAEEKNNDTYATQDLAEMFAECYSILMTNNTEHSVDFVVKNFPKTFQAAKEHIQYLRSLPLEKRVPIV